MSISSSFETTTSANLPELIHGGTHVKLYTHDENVPANTSFAHNPVGDVFDFIVCGAGSSGSVVAARLAENENASVLLLEAGGDHKSETVSSPAQWPLNLGSSRDWGFVGQPTPGLDGRRLPLSMGKGLGGGSSINVMYGPGDIRKTGITLPQRPGMTPGAISRSLATIAGSKTGKALRTLLVAG